MGKKVENLIQRQFEGTKPYEKCYTDVMEFALPNCSDKLYLSPVLDGYNSEIIAFSLSHSLGFKQVQTMLERLFQLILTQKQSFIVIRAGSINTSLTMPS